MTLTAGQAYISDFNLDNYICNSSKVKGVTTGIYCQENAVLFIILSFFVTPSNLNKIFKFGYRVYRSSSDYTEYKTQYYTTNLLSKLHIYTNIQSIKVGEYIRPMIDGSTALGILTNCIVSAVVF